MFSSPIEEIKNRLDIVEVVGNYVKLQKAGANWRTLCPFHSEKGPSFFVSPSRQIWHCFGGCGEGGDMFKFIMKIEGIEFGDALRLLAARAGVELSPRDPSFAKLQTERARLYEIEELATRFFEKQLFSSTGKEVRAYLAKRGLGAESVAKWRLGYAPESARALCKFLESKGYSGEEIGRAGLLVRSGEEIYDRFRSRIIFPIFDLHSQVIGFGGRIFGQNKESLAKYINTSNTLIYDKSRILYGLDKAKVPIRQKDFCVVVEGYMDAILVSQAGCENVVAVSGTALTSFHLGILKRYSENLSLAFDMDLGGDAATKRGIDLALASGFALKVVMMSEGKDPADVIAENSAKWEELTGNACSILDFYFQRTFARFDKDTVEGKKEIGKILLPIIKKIPNKIEQAYWVSFLAKELNVSEQSIEEELKKAKNENADFSRATEISKAPAVPKTRRELLEERTLILFFHDFHVLNVLDEEHLSYFSPQSQNILMEFKKHERVDQQNFGKMFSGKFDEFLTLIALKAEIENETAQREEKEILAEFALCLEEVKALTLREKLDEISREIKQAQQVNDSRKIGSLMQEFYLISKTLHDPAPKQA